MKVLIRSFAFLLLSIMANVQLMFSQGVLIFELSDSNNAPIQKMPINISGKDEAGNDTMFVLTTDDNGRMVNSSIPAGDYSYTLDYGDYGQGSFKVTSGGYTWIDLDYRSLVVAFTDSSGNPQQGRSLVLFKEFEDGQEDYEFEKRYSRSDGQIVYILPEGKYHYNAGGVLESFVLDDENKTMNISALSGVVTHNTYFRFIKEDSTDVSVWCKSIKVYSKDASGAFSKLYGRVDPYSQDLNQEYYQINLTPEYISCAEAQYLYSVETKDHGTLSDTFVVKKSDDIMRHIAYIVLPDSNGGDGGGEDNPNDSIPDFPQDSSIVVLLNLVVLDTAGNPMPDTRLFHLTLK